MPESDQRVLVTGASGFIGLHCIRELLSRGYDVRGTVRSLGREEEIRTALGTALGETATRLELVEADLTRDDGWAGAVAGCDYVLHVASPVPLEEPEDENDLIIPAKEGALRVLKAAHEAGVKRVVMTSSVAAIVYGHGEDRVFTEDDWTDIDATDPPVSAYAKSKTIAERAARDYIASLPAGEGPEYATINPGLVLGPMLSPDGSPSLELIRKMMAKEVPGCARLGWAPVDVRDIAWLHVEAMIRPEAAGGRFCCALEHTWMVDYAKILKAGGYKVPTVALPNFVIRIVAMFDKTVRMVLPEIGRREDVSSARAREILGWSPRSIEDMTLATAESLKAHGIV